jgi:hypothetical protein
MRSLRQSSLTHIITWLLFYNCWTDISSTALLHYCTCPAQRNLQTYIMNNILKYYFSHKSITSPLPSLSSHCCSICLALSFFVWEGLYSRNITQYLYRLQTQWTLFLFIFFIISPESSDRDKTQEHWHTIYRNQEQFKICFLIFIWNAVQSNPLNGNPLNCKTRLIARWPEWQNHVLDFTWIAALLIATRLIAKPG